MQQLDSMYDIIFQDAKIRKVLLNFHSSIWDTLTVFQKQKVIKELNGRIAHLYGYKENKINKTQRASMGSHDAFKWEINISEDVLETSNGYDVLDTYFHELRHAFQARAVQNKLTDKETVSEEDKQAWKKNLLPQNYFGGDSRYYKFQALEKDAWKTGLLFARKVYFMNKRVIGKEDPKWEEYCSKYKQVIMTFVSDSKAYKKLIEINEREIDKIYSSNKDDISLVDKGIFYVDEILSKKSIQELDFTEVGILLSPYAFINLDIRQKVDLIKRYCSIVKIGDGPIEIGENTVGSIKIEKELYSLENSYGLVNSILTINFKRIVELVINDADDDFEMDKKAREEIKLNMYRNKKGTYINFVPDTENMLLYSIQPIARYESHYILSEFKKLKDVEYKAYGENSRVWAYWQRLYDNRLIFKTFAKLVDMPFKQYYQQQLLEYKQKIIKEEQKNKNTQ